MFLWPQILSHFLNLASFSCGPAIAIVCSLAGGDCTAILSATEPWQTVSTGRCWMGGTGLARCDSNCCGTSYFVSLCQFGILVSFDLWKNEVWAGFTKGCFIPDFCPFWIQKYRRVLKYSQNKNKKLKKNGQSSVYMANIQCTSDDATWGFPQIWEWPGSGLGLVWGGWAWIWEWPGSDLGMTWEWPGESLGKVRNT